MDTSDLLIWLLFLIGAPALLYWMWRGNRKRRERWREWCGTHGWRIMVDRDRGIDAQAVLPAFPIGPAHLKHDAIDLHGDGLHQGAAAATLEWTMVGRFRTTGRRRTRSGNTLHAVACHAPVRFDGRLALLPNTMALLSMTGFLDLPAFEAGMPGWHVHADDEALARRWLQANATALERTKAPELAMLQVEGDWLVAWHHGETKVERIESALAWLSGFEPAAHLRG